MNKKTFKGLAAVVALLSTSVVNAVTTVTLDPSATTVNEGDAFTLNVAGIDFTNGVSSGTISLNWDTAVLELTDPTTAALQASAALNGFTTFIADTTTAGQLDFVFTSILGMAGPSLPFFSLDFTTIASSPGTIVTSAIGPFGPWTDATVAGDPINGIIFNNSAPVAVNAVPVPAAVWLFGSGLIGLAGIARRSNTKALG